MKLRTTKTKWRTHAGTAPAYRLEYRIFTAVQFVHNALLCKEQRVGMSIGVVSNHVVSRGNFCRQPRICLHILAKNEERRAHVLLFENRK
jgi:hypothetical protein